MKVKLLLSFNLCALIISGQSWVQDSSSIHDEQFGIPGEAFNVQFKSSGPFGKSWMYGSFWDKDSIKRCVAYREGGAWVPIPFSGNPFILAYDIAQVGDTLLIGGSFWDIVLDASSQALPMTGLLKVYKDSIWSDPRVNFPFDIEVFGDTVLMWGNYADAVDTIGPHIISYDGGNSYQYPYSTIHPYLNYGDFGPVKELERLSDGSIFTVINSSPRINPFSGSTIWNGTSWLSLGNGLAGLNSRAFQLAVYNGSLIMGGSFSKNNFPGDPANFIAKWNGASWEDIGGGVTDIVSQMFIYKSQLYVMINGGNPANHQFGDLHVPYFASWDGTQWCGSSFNYSRIPNSFGVINDTLFVSFTGKSSISGTNVGYLAFFDGDYFSGSNSQCSTPGIGIEGHISTNPILIYPNPTSGLLRIKTGEMIHSIRAYDLVGNAVKVELLDSGVTIPPGRHGVFILEVEVDGVIHRERIVKY